MHDFISPILEILGEAASSAPFPDRPRWLRWGCAIFSIGVLVLIIALIAWSR
jgi:hypothetical protein